MANEKKAKKVTLVSVIKAVGVTGAKNKADLAKKVLEKCTKQGMTTNSKGHTITEKNVTSLVNAFVRDISIGRKGHWESLEVKQDENSIKILPRA